MDILTYTLTDINHTSIADPGCHFLIPDPDNTNFSSQIKDPESYTKRGLQSSFFLALMLSGAKS
jgi:hypothetical protein